MSHKLQLHLLLDHISAKITANAAIGLCSLASHFSWPIHPLCLWTTGSMRRKIHTFCNIAVGEVKHVPNPGPAFTSRIKLQPCSWSEMGTVSADSDSAADCSNLGPHHFWCETNNDSWQVLYASKGFSCVSVSIFSQAVINLYHH